MAFFGASLAWGSALELLLSPTTELVVASCCIKSTFHHTLQSNWEMVCCCIELRDMALHNRDCFWFSVSSWGTHLPSFFTFPIYSRCWMTIEWSTLSSSATSYTVIRGSALTMALKWSLSASDGWPLCSSSSRLWSPLENFLNHHCTVYSLAVSGPKCVDVMSFLCCFMIHFELGLKNHLNLLFV